MAKAQTKTVLTVRTNDATAVVTAVGPGSGTPQGSVRFTIDGVDAGTVTLDHGKASLGQSISDGQEVAAVYDGDTDFAESSDSTSRKDPVITAVVTGNDSGPKAGWYSGPVKVTFTCTEGSAPLSADGCPACGDAVGGGRVPERDRDGHRAGRRHRHGHRDGDQHRPDEAHRLGVLRPGRWPVLRRCGPAGRVRRHRRAVRCLRLPGSRRDQGQAAHLLRRRDRPGRQRGRGHRARHHVQPGHPRRPVRRRGLHGPRRAGLHAGREEHQAAAGAASRSPRTRSRARAATSSAARATTRGRSATPSPPRSRRARRTTSASRPPTSTRSRST